jgi:hypothetical protein
LPGNGRTGDGAGLAQPIAGLTEASITIPNPSTAADAKPKLFTLGASVNASGLVQANDTIDAAANSDDWKPSKEFHQLDGQTVSGVKSRSRCPARTS